MWNHSNLKKYIVFTYLQLFILGKLTKSDQSVYLITKSDQCWQSRINSGPYTIHIQSKCPQEWVHFDWLYISPVFSMCPPHWKSIVFEYCIIYKIFYIHLETYWILNIALESPDTCKCLFTISKSMTFYIDFHDFSSIFMMFYL